MRKIMPCLILSITMIVCVACDNGGETARPRGRLQVQQDGDAIEVRGPDGAVLIKGNKKNASVILNAGDKNEVNMEYSTNELVPDFPDDIPVPPECSVTMNQVFQNGRNAIATLTTSEECAEVVSFYEEQIPLKGWDPGDRFDLDNIVMLNGKRDHTSLNISITANDGTTTINIARTENME